MGPDFEDEECLIEDLACCECAEEHDNAELTVTIYCSIPAALRTEHRGFLIQHSRGIAC